MPEETMTGKSAGDFGNNTDPRGRIGSAFMAFELTKSERRLIAILNGIVFNLAERTKWIR
jgi:hypothetical protein